MGQVFARVSLGQRDAQAQLPVSSAGPRAGLSVANVNLVSRQPQGLWILQLRKMRLREGWHLLQVTQLANMVTAYWFFPAWGLCSGAMLQERPWAGCSGGGLMRSKGSLQKGHLCGALLDAKSGMERHSMGKTQTGQRLCSRERMGAWQKCPRTSHTSGGLDCRLPGRALLV